MQDTRFELEIDARLLQTIKALSGALGITPSRFIWGVLVDWFANHETRAEVFPEPSRPLFEFQDVGNDTGALYQSLKGLYASRYQNEWRNCVFIKSQQGMPLDEAEQAYVDGIRERAEKLKADRARLKELQAEGLIPANFYGPAASAVNYCEMFKAGKLSRERLDSILSKYKR